MFLYETHLHTSPVSKCARATVEESLKFYKKLGYDGVFITNHFLDGNINYDKKRPYAEQIEFYFSAYEEGLSLGNDIGIKVFCGVELTYGGTDFLIYGKDKQWYLDHPEIMEMKKSDELRFLAEAGALVIQAHPYREASYIDHIRLYPREVHGVEIVNASRSEEENDLARIYADFYKLLHFAGSDNHVASAAKRLAGIRCENAIECEADLIERIKGGEYEIFTINNPLQDQII
ncbi:MAG: histidinol phosphatase [Clostridia bacterium]|nr:histidinol phosphatase [Clostridia bacterium]